MPLKIAIIDDEPNILVSMQRVLVDTPYDVITFDNPLEAIRQLPEKDLAVVISDQRMPGLTGTDFLQQVREQHPEAIRILMSGYNDFDSLTTAVNKAKIFNFLHKPWDEQSLLLEVEKAMFQYIGLKEGLTARQRRNLETFNLRDQLSQRQNMAALGALSRGIAHDFNKMVFLLMGFTDLSLLEVPSDPVWDTLRDYLQGIQGVCDEAKNLVAQLLSFSKDHQENNEPLHLKAIVEKVLDVLQKLLPSNVSISWNDKSKDDLVMADATQMYQLLMNLCLNASQALPQSGGTLKISLRDREITSSLADKCDITPGSYVELSVSDNGIGMSPEIMGRIFQPLFTTKGSGQNSGLGLFIVKKIVEDHQGNIQVISTPGQGATFQIILPKISTFKKSQYEVMGLPQGNEEIILVVMAQESETAPLTFHLNLWGYRFQLVNGQQAALAQIQTHSQPFNLIITDYLLTDCTGIELALQLKKLNYDMPLILCYEPSEPIDHTVLQQLGVKGIINKPLKMKKTAMVIRHVLDQALAK